MFRRCRLRGSDGSASTKGDPRLANVRVRKAALGLVAVLAAERAGHDLRSRCLLVPCWDEQKKRSGALALEAVARDGSTTPLELDLDGAIALYEEAVKNLPDGLKFEKPAGEPLATLKPSPKLAHLITRSRDLVAAGADIGDE